MTIHNGETRPVMNGRDWTLEEVDEQPGYGSENVAAYRCENCGNVNPQTFVQEQENPPDELPHIVCGEIWDGCGEWGPQTLVEVVRWVGDSDE